MTKKDMINPPRFRTLHEAGKYMSAQLYADARELPAEAFGAVPQHTPIWEAPYRVEWYSESIPYGFRWDFTEPEVQVYERGFLDEGEFDHLVARLRHALIGTPSRTKRLTSAQWMLEPGYENIVILMPSGWDSVDNFYDYFNYAPIDQSEFDYRLSQSILENK